MGKYDPLREFLRSLEQDEITLSFTEIEDIIAAPLPPSARRHRAWWTNNDSMPQARAWLGAGWKVSQALA